MNYILPLLVRLRGRLLLALGLSLVTLAAGIGLLGVSGWFLTAAALSTAGAAFNLFAPSAGVRGLSFLRILSRYGEKVAGHDATLRLLSDLRRTTFADLFRIAPLARRFGRADLVSRLVADLDMLDAVFLVGVGPIAAAAATGAAMTILLAALLPQAAPIYAASIVLAAIVVPGALIAVSRRTGIELVAASAALRARALDAIEGHQDLLLFGAAGRAADAATTAADSLGRVRMKLARYNTFASAAVQALNALILVATLGCGLAAVQAQRIDGPVLAGVLLAIVASFEATGAVVRGARGIAGAAAAAERLWDLANAPPTVTEQAASAALPDGGEIAFDQVCFGYGGRANVLEGVSFRIGPGECAAITGPSGAGKSTIAQLMVRLADPLSGTVRINGRDIRQAGADEVRRRVALMTQDAPVFNDTVRANLLIGRPDATDPELAAMLERVGLAQALQPLGGLDAMLGEGGRSLSAGQARRICLARTLLSPAPIVVLDEPTSGLDGDIERQLLADIPILAAGRTMVVITHAETPASFGRRFELRAGRIQEAATR
ncbi:thiol reductant ABC exporter subunit CydC [Hypericibacter adhaerens]|uniref:thiol reductant ABC exporter subunit CydC n=1 Tax=Hypericibacter adhaerens TaxID=2602016 RepID=UPI002D7FE341|nr:thiol reductant ABC exporter subunit CydC [Hypericibacter adhaerens]